MFHCNGPQPVVAIRWLPLYVQYTSPYFRLFSQVLKLETSPGNSLVALTFVKMTTFFCSNICCINFLQWNGEIMPRLSSSLLLFPRECFVISSVCEEVTCVLLACASAEGRRVVGVGPHPTTTDPQPWEGLPRLGLQSVTLCVTAASVKWQRLHIKGQTKAVVVRKCTCGGVYLRQFWMEPYWLGMRQPTLVNWERAHTLHPNRNR